MQLKISTDYAMRIILYIAIFSSRGRIPSGELAKGLGIPQSMVLKLGNRLKETGFVDITAGVAGGFKLRRPPEEISMFDIINAFEPTTRINRCLEEDKYCSRFATDNCPVRNVYSEMQTIIEDRLKSTTVKKLIEERQESGKNIRR